MTAAHVSVELEIGVTPEIAYAAVSDVTRMGEWSPETYRVTWLERGRRFRGWNRNGRARWFTTGTVVTDEPGRAFGFDVDLFGVPIASWAFRFEPADAGRCTVVETWTDRRGSGPVGRAVRTLGAWTTRAPHDLADTPVNMRTTLERLRATLEAQPST